MATGSSRVGDEPSSARRETGDPMQVIVVPEVHDGSTVNGPGEPSHAATDDEVHRDRTGSAATPVARSLPGVARDPASARAARLSRAGIAARAVVAVLIAATVLLLPLPLDNVWRSRMALAVIFAVIGLSVNVITGHAGQISLGHQAFVGIGAFMSAYIVARFNFAASLIAAGLTGAVLALILGLVALRIRGLYLALITLAFGLMAENSIFNLRGFTGGGAGAPAPRPTLFRSDLGYVYLCRLKMEFSAMSPNASVIRAR